MRSTPVPESVRFASLGASGDLTVPGTATADPQADVQRLIPTPSDRDAHDDLAAMPATTREIALAVAGRGATCQSGWRGGGRLLPGRRPALDGDDGEPRPGAGGRRSDPDRTGGGVAVTD